MSQPDVSAYDAVVAYDRVAAQNGCSGVDYHVVSDLRMPVDSLDRIAVLAEVSGRKFSNVKIAFDVTCVILAVLLSFIFFDFTIVGTREGTIISALLTGFVVKLFLKLVKKPLESVL